MFNLQMLGDLKDDREEVASCLAKKAGPNNHIYTGTLHTGRIVVSVVVLIKMP